MQLNSSISKHKADIQKRIQQLQNKLKAPHLKLYDQNPPTHNQPERNYEIYDESSKLQMSNIYAKQNSRQSRYLHYKNQNHQPLAENVHRSRMENIRDISFNEVKLTKSNFKHEDFLNSNQRRDICDLMEVIIEGQRNLEKQISQLKSQWSKTQSHKKNVEIQKQKVVKFQEPFSQKIQPRMPMKPSRVLEEKKPNQIKNLNQASRRKTIRNSEQRNRSEIKQKIEKQSKRENRSKHKGSLKKKQNTIDMNALIENQKYKNERLIVEEGRKNQLWKVVEVRIRESQNQFKDSFHRNNKHEHEHLLYTNQLQKKLKQDLISRVHSQCNGYIYK